MRIVTCLLVLTIFILPVQAQTNSPTRIVFWHPWTGEQAIMLETLVTQFNTEHPTIQVIAESQNNSGRLYDRVIANLLNPDPNLLPNVMLVPADDAALFALSDRLVDFGENQWGMWFESDGEVLVINESARAEMGIEAPAGLAELVEQGCVFRQNGGWSGGKFGTTWGGALPLRGTFVEALAVAQNTPLWQDGTYQLADLQPPLSQLAQAENSACFYIMLDPQAALDDFASGRTLFFFTTTSQLRTVEQAVAGKFIAPFPIGVYPLPAGEEIYASGLVLSIIQVDVTQDDATQVFVTWLAEHWTPTEFPASLYHAPMLAAGTLIHFELEAMWKRVLQTEAALTTELPATETRINEILEHFTQ